MKHIKTPVGVFPHWAQTDMRDAEGEMVASCNSGAIAEEQMKQIAAVLNEHDKLVAEREGLWYALLRAEQTFRNLASDGSIVTMGTSLEIARNELENMRDALKLGKTE